ncbi:cytochrome C biogenesis protein [Canicola haemoglobinophilus]|uniref:Thiol:disulfide interchange protein n=1 Tax=Canicola haemoglobinophilus TaxID=733 RepID=A0A1V4B2N8_9PAST|nr:cytochrome c biogenesis CcdA family protein [Canicola haemoglobinophilus]OOS01517.1 cytochrome C biogenesis protein [Canicola haemoglobinophilus]STO54552.1 thiol:disulfide interchange protein precursor [Canicola haemoglobinophilus]STO59975.1 thiol:disulfide interchange protein precursor [Canicola haemoglobinophilus]STO67673.1 thiol:disulfide interchange protein precursor [Canicola haemoglobinophilus]
MDISITILALSTLAGLLTTLSPCVLPILPIVASSAMAKRKIGLFTLALGMAISFTFIGTIVASIGLALGLDSQYLRYIAAIMMLFVAIWLLSSRLQEQVNKYTSRLSSKGDAWLSQFSPESALGQFFVGLLLGVVWAPCIGPTLGAAIALASQGEALFSVALVMIVFSFGAIIPLIIIGLISRQFFREKREKLANAGTKGRRIMGYSLLVVGLLVLTGFDKQLEIWLIQISPDWLTDLTTQF